MAVDPTIAVVETAEALVEATGAEMVATGTIDYKKVALVAGLTAGTAVGAYLVYRAIKKRKANQEIIESAEIVEEVDDGPEVVILEKK